MDARYTINDLNSAGRFKVACAQLSSALIHGTVMQSATAAAVDRDAATDAYVTAVDSMVALLEPLAGDGTLLRIQRFLDLDQRTAGEALERLLTAISVEGEAR